MRSDTERGPIDRTTAKAIQEIDGGPIQAAGKALVTDGRWPQAMGTDQEFTGPREIDLLDSISTFRAPHIVPFKPSIEGVDYALPAPAVLLKNGTIVVAALRTERDEALVVTLTNGQAGHTYATHRMDLKTGNTYSGDYTNNLEEALETMRQRTVL